MVDYIVEQRVVIGRPRPDVFAFFADVGHASQLTPPWLRLERRGGATRLQTGAVLDYDLRVLGLPVPWRRFVRECDPPFRFLEVQVRGPFARWEHRHRFLAEGMSTLLEDRLVYRLPGGWAGRAAHFLLGERMMAAAWAYRQRRLEELLGRVSPWEA